MYRFVCSVAILVFLIGTPTAAHAAVVISEIAWMGTSANANAEWIELQNTGSESVDLTGWTLTSSTGAPTISIKGTIAGNSFFLLERTSDTSVPDVSADLIYSGALANTGATLYLKNGAGESIDVVEGGTDWKNIGGNNTSKQTPQRTGNSWVEGTPTPRAATGTSGSSGNTAASSTDPLTPETSVQGSPVVIVGSNPIARLSIDAGPGRIIALGAEVPFTAYVYDSEGSLRRDAELTWNFGDGSVATGDEVYHTYINAGTYTVTIAAYSGYAHVVSLLTVRVDESVLNLDVSQVDQVIVRNQGPSLVDMSGWILRAGDIAFRLPPYSVVREGHYMILPRAYIGFASTTDVITLYANDGRVVAVSSTTASRISSNEEAPTLQPEGRVLGIQTVEDAIPRAVITNTQSYEDAHIAPGALPSTSAPGARPLVFKGLLESPWTASFIGLVLAAGAALVIL